MSKIICLDDLYDILPFGKTKINQLLKSGVLPVTQIGRDYITTDELLQEWIKRNIGKKIIY